MASVNKITLVGNLGNDPESDTTPSGLRYTRFSLATTERARKDKDGNKVEPKPDWHRVVCFGKAAEIAAEYLRKGRQVYLEGRVRYGKYEKDGVTHYTTDIIANDIQFLSKAPEGDKDADTKVSATASPADVDFNDDDIPF